MTKTLPSFPTAELTIIDQPLSALRPNPRNARTHSKRQIGKIADSIRAFGFTVPLVVDEVGLVLAGHGRLMAAKQLNLGSVPTVRLDRLSETQKRACAVADNKLATLAGWDRQHSRSNSATSPFTCPRSGSISTSQASRSVNSTCWSVTSRRSVSRRAKSRRARADRAPIIRCGYRVYRPEADIDGEDLVLRSLASRLCGVQLKGRLYVEWQHYGGRDLLMLSLPAPMCPAPRGPGIWSRTMPSSIG